MNHISKYRDFEIIDEKINWKRFLISFGIAYGLITGYKDIRDLRDARKIYSDITNPSSIPTPSERSTIDSIKNDLIAKVESSDLFNRFGKKYIIDSLKNTQFRVVDDIPIKFNGVILGMYIDIKKIKDEKKYKFLEIPKGDNFILIRRDKMNEPDFPETIIHELYHYLDRLYSKDTNRRGIDLMSSNMDINSILDQRLFDKQYACNKLSILLSGEKYRTLPPNMKGNVDDLYDILMDNRGYYASNGEVFARWQTFKHRLVNNDIIKTTSQTITKQDVMKLFKSEEPNMVRLSHKSNKKWSYDDLIISFFIDLDQIDKIDI